MIELADDFRDLLIELHDAGAAFAVVGGHAVAFGAPLSMFAVKVEDFAIYDGVLQIGLPPYRIDILNRIQGITFDEAVADGESFEIAGRAIPVIGREALLKNKRAVGRAQDLADVEAPDRST